MSRALVFSFLLVTAADASPFGQSSVVYRNQVSVVSLDRANDLTYDPFYLMSVGLQPRASLGAGFYARAGLSVARELTDSNWTTEADETYLSDTTLAAGGRLWTVPVADIDLSGELGARFATSKASLARTLQAAVEPSVRVSRRFGVLSGLTVGYGFAFGVDFHEATTAQRVEPQIFAEARTANTGVRNTKWRMSHTGDVSLALLEPLSVSVSVGLHIHQLHPAMDLGDYEPAPDREQRELLSASAGLTYAPWRALAIGVGAQTFHDQLGSDGTRRDPLLNRFTNLYFDLRFTPEALLATDSENQG